MMGTQDITVERLSGDLARRIWQFTLYDLPRIRLSFYGEQERATRRHKFRSKKSYSRLDPRSHNIREEPDVPDDVIEEAIEQVFSRIEFRKGRR